MARTLNPLPVPSVTELTGRDAYEALVQHFGFSDEDTAPMPLDELPSLPTVQQTDFDRVMDIMAPRRTRNG